MVCVASLCADGMNVSDMMVMFFMSSGVSRLSQSPSPLPPHTPRLTPSYLLLHTPLQGWKRRQGQILAAGGGRRRSGERRRPSCLWEAEAGFPGKSCSNAPTPHACQQLRTLPLPSCPQERCLLLKRRRREENCLLP